MDRRPVLIVRIALFAALIYVLSWGTSYLPNVNLVFFIVFTAGFLWGAVPGILVGAVGMGLWTVLNPYGPAAAPVMAAQIVGAAASGPVGGVFRSLEWRRMSMHRLTTVLLAAAAGCTVLFYAPVNTVDAMVFGPFWPRFIGGLIWAAISLAANLVIFPLLFGAARYLYDRGWAIK
jgi:hypothetical protein